MFFIEKPLGKFIDKKSTNEESIDIVMLTLDAEHFLEKTLFSIYKEISINKLIVCDGGSKDKTVEIFEKFPRTEVFVKPDIKTTGKALEFAFSKVKTSWFVLIDSDIILEDGWYDKMFEHSKSFDVIENGKRINAFHFYREQNLKSEKDQRSLDFCHLLKKEAIKNFHVDDDYMWRYTDILFRQNIEKNGYRYGKANNIFHVHNETERIPYASDSEKNFQEVKFYEPQFIIHDQKKLEKSMLKHAKAVVKYLDPEYPMVKKDLGYESIIRLLERKWIETNGPKWLKRYDSIDKKSSIIKRTSKRAQLKIKRALKKQKVNEN